MTREELISELDNRIGFETDNETYAMSESEKEFYREIRKALEPKTGYCKDCKWWKDSDGTYRRDVRAESKCPINTKTVYLGDGYCYKFEPKVESEE